MERRKSSRKKKVFLTIGEKTKILQDFESGCTITDLCKKYDIDRSVIYKWKRKQGVLQTNVQKHSTSRILRRSPNRLINDSVFAWFREIKKSDILPTGPAIKAKALGYYEQIGGTSDFVASTGWLDWWKKTYNINQLRVDPEIATKRTTVITDFIKGKQLGFKQIFCADETALYYKTLPFKVPNAEVKSESGEVVEDRLTVMPCCNADGSFKLPLLVLGKSRKASRNHPLATYVIEKQAWLNRRIFQRWFENEFVPRVKMFLKQERLPMQAVLIVDQAHPYNIEQNFIIDDIKIAFLPPVMPMNHPMNQGIIDCLKKRYRIDFLGAFMSSMQNKDEMGEFLRMVTMDDVLSWLSKAWGKVDAETIANCWLPLLSTSFSVESREVKRENDRGSLSEQLVDMFIQLNNGEMINVDDMENWVTGDQVHFANGELDDVIVANALDSDRTMETTKPESVETHVFIKKEESEDEVTMQHFEQDPLELQQDNTEEILTAFDKIIEYCEQKQIASAKEIATLISLRQKV